MALRPTAIRPTITGTMEAQTSTNESSVRPFSSTVVADMNPGAIDTLTIVLEGPGGTLSGNGLTTTGAKTYTLSGTAPQVTAELQALSFIPVTGKPGSQATTRFRLTDRSSAATNMPATDNTTSVMDTDTPAAPAAPRLTTATDTGVSHTDELTDDATPSITGSARPGAIVTIYAGNTILGQGTANADTGAYTIAISGLAQGSNAISATQTAHGLTSVRSATRTVTLDTTAPIISAVAETVPGIGASGNGIIGTGKKVTFTLTTSEPTYVTDGKPTLTLNDGGVATYEGGSGKNQLKFSYTVAAGQNTNSLQVTGVSTNGATVTDKAGNALNLNSLNPATMPTGKIAVHTIASSDGRVVTVDTAGETVNLQPFSIVHNQGEANTSFVFNRGIGLDVVDGFKLGGTGHDTIDLPSADFANLAAVLHNTGDVQGSAFITDPKTGDAIRFAGVTTAELKANPKDFIFG